MFVSYSSALLYKGEGSKISKVCIYIYMFKKLKKKNDQEDKENYFLLNEEEVQDPTHLLLTTLSFVSFQETEKKTHSHMRRFELHCPKILCPAHVGMV